MRSRAHVTVWIAGMASMAGVNTVAKAKGMGDIPEDLTVDFSRSGDGPGFVAQYPGKCMTEDLCELGDISPGDYVKYNPDGPGVVHTACLARDNGGTSSECNHRRVKGYSDERAADKPTRFKGTSMKDMGY